MQGPNKNFWEWREHYAKALNEQEQQEAVEDAIIDAEAGLDHDYDQEDDTDETHK